MAILDEAFAAIATATANAEKNLENARELFESQLERAFAEVRAVGRTPLSDLCYSDRIITYGVIKLGNAQSDGTPCLRTSNVRRLRIDTNGVKRISPELSKEYKRTVLCGGEVLVNVRGTLGGVSVVPKAMAGWNVSREVAVVPARQKDIAPEFLSLCIATRESQSWLTGAVKGVAYKGINIADLRRLPIPVPSMKLQLEIASRLNEAELLTEEVAARYQEKLSTLGSLRQALLNMAFTGQLTNSEKTAEHLVAQAAV